MSLKSFIDDANVTPATHGADSVAAVEVRMEARRLAMLVHGTDKEKEMGKYVLGWLLGVPTLVLVLLWLFFR